MRRRLPRSCHMYAFRCGQHSFPDTSTSAFQTPLLHMKISGQAVIQGLGRLRMTPHSLGLSHLMYDGRRTVPVHTYTQRFKFNGNVYQVLAVPVR